MPIRPPKRRPADVTVHEYQHSLIKLKRLDYAGLHKYVPRHIKREYYKAWVWSLQGHLQQFHMHHSGTNLGTKTGDELQAMHDELHRKESEA